MICARGRDPFGAQARLRAPATVDDKAREARMPAPTDTPPTDDLLTRSTLPALRRASVLGIDLALTDYEGTMDWMDDVIRRRRRACVSAAAVHLVMVARDDSETRHAVERMVTVPDGVPLVWALRALGHPEATRVYGPDLMARYCARAARNGVPMYLYGGRSDEALARLTHALHARFAGLRIVGGWSPPFRPLTEAERDDVTERINASGADVVWVGTGQPKQEKWMAEMRDRLDAPILAGVGAAFDFHAGIVPQAPSWMQRMGLEWSYRLAREPRRLWRRYLSDNPRFIVAFARQYAAHRAGR
jgi:N-acetylglucosaminyldiphosphoundecaprenol N-acetyl-beta-D-mannosaminyltransferase